MIGLKEYAYKSTNCKQVYYITFFEIQISGPFFSKQEALIEIEQYKKQIMV